MKKLLSSIALVLLISPPVFAEIHEFVLPEELEAGQKGYGLTVFKGNEPERFEVEFVSTTAHPNHRSEKAILVRLGKPLQNSNVIAGMSGSPIYFKHQGKWKLAGALAFGYTLPTNGEAVAGVTPIHLMMNQREILTLKESVELEPKPLTEKAKESPDVKTSEKLKPGDAIAMVLADGDHRSYGFGTVTYVRGNQFWAFGHAGLGDGDAMIPAHKIEMAISLKGLTPSFKISKELKAPVGIITYDNIFGIEGKIQEVPNNAMLPVKLQLTNQKGGYLNFSFRVLKNKLYAPELMANGIATLLKDYWTSNNSAGAVTTAIIDFEDRLPIILNDSMALGETESIGPFPFVKGPWVAAYKPLFFVDELFNSDFDFRLNGVQIRINLQPIEKTLYLEELLITNNNGALTQEARLGEKINLIVGLRSRNSLQKFLRVIPFQIPEKLEFQESDQDKILTFHVSSGNRFQEQDAGKVLTRPPTNQEEFLYALLLNEQPAQKIFVQAVLPPTKISSTPPMLSEMPKEKWLPVKSLDFLKALTATEVKILTTGLASPLEGAILEIDQKISIKLLLPETKPPEKKNPKVSKTAKLKAKLKSLL